MKKLAVIILTLVAVSASSTVALAQVGVPAAGMPGTAAPVTTTTTSGNPAAVTALTGTSSAGTKPGLALKEQNLRNRADTEIQRRLTALNELLTRVNNLKHVSATNKTTYTTAIQTEVTNLTALKTKIDADTDAATLKTDVKSIVDSYRIFALFMPQIRLLSASDSITDITDNLTALTGKLQTRITTAQSAGQNVASLQTLLTDMQTKIADAKTQATTIATDVAPLTPAGYPGNKTTLEAARKTLQSAFQDLKTAGQDAKQIITALVAMKDKDMSASGSAQREEASPSGTMPGKLRGSEPGAKLKTNTVLPAVQSTTP
ncbi:MAG: hypothetical protein ACM3IJ_05680 [Candidatus Levyibacteriota bacterium]